MLHSECELQASWWPPGRVVDTCGTIPVAFLRKVSVAGAKIKQFGIDVLLLAEATMSVIVHSLTVVRIKVGTWNVQ